MSLGVLEAYDSQIFKGFGVQWILAGSTYPEPIPIQVPDSWEHLDRHHVGISRALIETMWV